MLKKIILYTIIYIVVSFLISFNEIQCALNGENLCWYNLIGKYIIFLLAITLYDKVLKPKIFKNNER
ncbi:hypothetical protein P3875_05155 [Myroides sp. JBRI-B21084]|uniref:hypothetical protein n=1 Tax=Myroides sp. JBRI-B21084 TaxID=3119977 RepID=UPI0026E19B78|nr:hypothetical protein [Paenimyroides cloacae]WKW47452.1 hypothetical protein P3875_05155 [Paenimyroides cloacae]